MTTLLAARRTAQLSHKPNIPSADINLTREERRRVALASLAIMEQRCQLRLAQIQADRRALLAGVAQ